MTMEDMLAASWLAIPVAAHIWYMWKTRKGD